jgi:hypothetical protein
VLRSGDAYCVPSHSNARLDSLHITPNTHQNQKGKERKKEKKNGKMAKAKQRNEARRGRKKFLFTNIPIIDLSLLDYPQKGQNYSTASTMQFTTLACSYVKSSYRSWSTGHNPGGMRVVLPLTDVCQARDRYFQCSQLPRFYSGQLTFRMITVSSLALRRLAMSLIGENISQFPLRLTPTCICML